MTAPSNPPEPPPPGGPPPAGPPPAGPPPPGGPPPAGPPPRGAPMGRDRTELWGWLGIIVGLLCCGLLGLVFGALSIREAKRHGKSPVLGYVAIAVSVLNVLFGLFRWSRGGGWYIYR